MIGQVNNGIDHLLFFGLSDLSFLPIEDLLVCLMLSISEDIHIRAVCLMLSISEDIHIHAKTTIFPVAVGRCT